MGNKDLIIRKAEEKDINLIYELKKAQQFMKKDQMI